MYISQKIFCTNPAIAYANNRESLRNLHFFQLWELLSLLSCIPRHFQVSCNVYFIDCDWYSKENARFQIRGTREKQTNIGLIGWEMGTRFYLQIFFRKYTAKNNSRTLNYYFYYFLAPLYLVWDPYTATRDRNLDNVVETGFMSLYLADFARLNQIFTKYLYRYNWACRAYIYIFFFSFFKLHTFFILSILVQERL